MGHVHGSDLFRSLRFLQERIDRLVVDTVEEVLEFRESLIHIGSKLDLCGRTLLHEILAGPAQILQMQEVEILLLEQTVFGGHKGLGYYECIHLIRLGIADISLPHGRGLDGVKDTEAVPFGNEEFDKVITVVSR